MNKLIRSAFITGVIALSARAQTSATAPAPSSAELATKILEITEARKGLRDEFDATVDGLVQKLAENGFPAAGISEIRTALGAWFDREIKWDEIKPRLAASYEKAFTQTELLELERFFETPTGKKAASKLPSIALESATIRQEYAAQKQELLNQTIQEIVHKYRR